MHKKRKTRNKESMPRTRPPLHHELIPARHSLNGRFQKNIAAEWAVPRDARRAAEGMTWACLSSWRRGWDRQESGSFRRGLVTNEEDPTRGSCSDKRQSPRQRQTRVSGCLLSRSNLERVRIETRGSTNNCLLKGQRSFYFRECERARRCGIEYGLQFGHHTHSQSVGSARDSSAFHHFAPLAQSQRDSARFCLW